MPSWYLIARGYIGVQEIPGPQSNPTILGWAKTMGGWVASWFRDDDTPWCALFVNACLQQAGLPLSGGVGSAALVRAKSFLTYGRPLDVPCRGAILVFDRAGGGHVGFYAGETLKAYRVVGGNQSNSVSEAWLAKDRCLAIRWPYCKVPPGDHYWLRPDGAALSQNEQ